MIARVFENILVLCPMPLGILHEERIMLSSPSHCDQSIAKSKTALGSFENVAIGFDPGTAAGMNGGVTKMKIGTIIGHEAGDAALG